MSFNFSKTLIIAVAIVLGFPGFALAGLQCWTAVACDGTSSEVVTLEMSGNVNAHAGLPNAGYPVKICCTGAQGLSNSCAGSPTGPSHVEVVAKLSGAKNAHIRDNTQADYPSATNACLSVDKGFVTVGYQDNNCDGYDTTIASMAKTLTNSHIGGPDAYIYKICGKYTGGSEGDNEDSSGGGGGGSSSSDDEPVLAPGAGQPSLVSFISNLIDSISGTDESDNFIPESGVAATDVDDALIFSQDELNQTAGGTDNLLTAAAGSIGSKLLNKPGSALVALGALLGLILVARKLYLTGKA